MLKNKCLSCFQTLCCIYCIMLINVEMPTFVGISTFMSMINYMLSWVEHEEIFIISGLDCEFGYRQNYPYSMTRFICLQTQFAVSLIDKNEESIALRSYCSPPEFTSVVSWWILQTVWIQIRPDKTSALIWIQAVWHSDGIPERFFWNKNWFW